MTHRPALYVGPTPEDLDRIPAALTTRPQWVLWQGADRIDKQTGTITGLEKVPINPHTLRKASSTDAATWGTFDQCIAALRVTLQAWDHTDPATYRGGGIGYVFATDDPCAGIDLDHCVDADTHAIAAWAQAYVHDLYSYTEITPSQTGLHILVESPLPPGGRKKGGVELYNQGRFFTVTGWHVPSTPPTIDARQEAVTRLHAQVFGMPTPPQARSTVPTLWTIPSCSTKLVPPRMAQSSCGCGRAIPPCMGAMSRAPTWHCVANWPSGPRTPPRSTASFGPRD